MPKPLAVILGFVAGALGGAIVFLLVTFCFYDSHGPQAWENAILSFVLFGTVPAALFGGALGVVAGIRVANQETRRAAITFTGAMGTVAVLTLIGAAGLRAVVLEPKSDAAERQKKQWARALGRLDPTLGLELAHSLLECDARSGSLTANAVDPSDCGYAPVFRIGASTAGFESFDKGWRWETVKTSNGYKVVVRPDPFLEQPGPIFEFGDDRLLVRREAPGALDFAIDSPIPAVAAYRECLEASGSDGCAHLEKDRGRAETGRMGRVESQWVRLVNPETAHLLIRLYPRGRQGEGSFALHIRARGRVYLYQYGDGWHVTNDRNTGIVTSTDPPPEPCELDTSVPCMKP